MKEETGSTELFLIDDTSLRIDHYQSRKLKGGDSYWIAVIAYDYEGNHLEEIQCSGPFRPIKNIFPILDFDDDHADNVTVIAEKMLIVEIDVDNPLDDEYEIKWYLNNIEDKKSKGDKFSKKMVKGYVGKQIM